MAKITKKCAYCGKNFNATCGAARFCSDLCQFMMNVKKSDGCWMWSGKPDKDGYGVAKMRGRRVERAHRLAFRLFNGDVESSLMVCHSCDNPGCVNPSHLFVGTALDNKRDCVAKGRHVKGEGLHWKVKLTPSDVVKIRNDKRPSRIVGAEYGVSDVNVQMIRKRAIWKHI